MASRAVTSIVLLLSLNLLFFNMVSATTCPFDALNFKVCGNSLGLIQIPPGAACCSLIEGLVDIDAALCLCTAIKDNVLGINLNVPVDLSLVLNNCGKKVPEGFNCS